MGTNYYWMSNSCPTCGHSTERIHIGKSSGGWCFGLHVYPDDNIRTWDDWKERIKSGVILNEYDKVVSTEKMLEIVEERSWERKYDWTPFGFGYHDEAHFHAKNYSERGTNGLLRHQIDGRHCIGHGTGTWDYLIGDFS